jgi:hypothetical protein
MKTVFHALFLCAWIALFAVSTGWATPIELSYDESAREYYVNMYKKETYELTLTSEDVANGITSFMVYDDGGKNGNYSDDCDGTLVMTAPEGYTFRIAGSYVGENYYTDVLSIYDGNINGNKLFSKYGSSFTVGPFVSNSGVLSVSYTSDGGVNDRGFDLKVLLVSKLDDDGSGYHAVVPVAGDGNAVIPEGATAVKVYDNGGADGNYSDNSDASFTLYAPNGNYLQLTGSIALLNGDYLSVIDGSERVLNEMSGTVSDIGTYVSRGQQLTFQFHSDEEGNAAGLDLNVAVLDGSVGHSVEVATSENGVLKSSIYSDVPLWKEVMLDATPAYGYVLDGVSVMAGETPVKVNGGKWYSAGVASFDMPYSDVAVTPSFTNDLTAANLHVEMPLAEAVNVFIPDGVTSFKVYDDGGSVGNYSANTSGKLVLTAPRGYVLKISGSVTTDGMDGLTIYDGTEGATTLLNNAGSVAPGRAFDIGTLFSRKNVMTLAFQSNGTTEYAGLDLTVTVVDASELHEVVPLPLTGGLISSDRQAAFIGDVVTLTITPEQDYEIESISVVDANGKSLPVTRGTGVYANTATFTMQDKDVSVSATFVKTVLSPSEITFDDQGCLADNTYFHVECGEVSSYGRLFYKTCRLSQIKTDDPGAHDYACWSGEVSLLHELDSTFDYLFETYNADVSADLYIELASNLYLGGYDATAGKCRMAFTPVRPEYDIHGEGKTIDGFCFVAPERQNAGFYDGYPNGSILDLTFANAYVKGETAGVISSRNNYQMLGLKNVLVDGAYVHGARSAGGLFGAATDADLAMFQTVGVKNSTIEVDVSENAEDGEIFAAGALAGRMSYSRNMLDTIVFENNTVRATGTSTATNGKLYLGGLIGYVEKHSWESDVSLVDNLIVVTGTAVEDASSYKQKSSVGGLIGYVEPSVSVSLSNVEFGGSITGGGTTGGIVGRVTHKTGKSFVVKGAVVNAVISGGAKMGGALGYYDGSDNGEDADAPAMMVNLSEIAFAGSVGKSCNTRSSVGGLVGEIYQEAYNTDLFTIEKSSVKSGSSSPVVHESACDGVALVNTNVGGIVGLVNEVESGNSAQGLNFTVKNTYSVGDISVAGATNSSVGYIAGAIVLDFDNFVLPTIFNNYHYGNDAVETGLGRYEYWNSLGAYTSAEWREGATGNFYANVRNGNASNGLAITGKLGYYKHSESNEESTTCDYGVEMFPYGVEEGEETNYYIALGQVVKNGVASDADMKSGVLAALMNLNPAVYEEDSETGEQCRVEKTNSVWAWSGGENDGLPFFNDGFRNSSEIVMMKVESPLSLTPEQQSNFGFYDAEAVFEDRTALVGAPYMVGATDAAGYVNPEFRENVKAVMDLFKNNANSPQQVRLTDGYDDLVDIAGKFKSTGKIFLKSANTYAVEYVYCAEEEDDCQPIDEVDDKTIVFTAPRLSFTNNDVSADSAVIPAAFVLDEVGSLQMGVEFLDETGEILQPEQENPYSLTLMPFPPSYYEIASYAARTLPATKTIRLKYGESGANYPNISLKQSSYADFEYEVFGVDKDGEKTVIQTGHPSNNPENDYSASVPYGMYLVAKDFAAKPGYTYESYTLEYEASEPRGCELTMELDSVEVENNYFVRADETESSLGRCESRKWIRRGLTDKDTIDLTDVRQAKLLKGDGLQQQFSIIANYKGIPYRIVFNSGVDLHLMNYDQPSVLKLYIENTGMPFPLLYSLDKTDSLVFPKLHGATYTTFRAISSRLYLLELAGWSLNEGNRNLVTENPTGIFTELSEEFIVAAQSYMRVGEDGINAIQLYPVWYKPIPEIGTNNINLLNTTQLIIDCEGFMMYGDYPYNRYCSTLPGTLVLSQKFINGGVETVWENVVDTRLDMYNKNGQVIHQFATMLPYGSNVLLDVDYRSAPGFKVKGVRFNQDDEKYVYDAKNKTLELKETMSNGTNIVATFDYELIRYNVKFDFSAYNGEIFVGKDAPVSQKMTLASEDAVVPKFYAVNKDNGRLDPVSWSIMVNGELKGYNEDTMLTQDLVRMHDEAYLEKQLVDGFDTMTLFANYENTFSSHADSWAYGSTMNIELIALTPTSDESGYSIMEIDGVKYERVYSSGNFPGKLVLTQSYANASERQLKHESGTYCEGYYCGQVLRVPAVDDTFSFAVSLKPDPGFGMELLGSDYYPHKEEWEVTPYGKPVNWGYNDETDSLIIQPSANAMTQMAFFVKFMMYDYNVTFLPPVSGSGVFVANEVRTDSSAGDAVYGVGWRDGGHVNAMSVDPPRLYNSEGCLVGWKVDGVADSHGDRDVLEMLRYATPLVSEEDATVNKLVPDGENPLCSDSSWVNEFYTLTLEIEGNGTLDMVQKVGESYVHHPFVAEDGVLTLRVPKTSYQGYENAGVTLMPVVLPEDGYELKELTYNISKNGNDMTVVMEDSAALNIAENQRWHVKFGSFDPVYIAFDLALNEDDSSKVWLPSDAVANGEYQITADGTDIPLWVPYRADKCFAGWMLSGLPQFSGDGEVEIIKIVSDLTVQNISDYSTSAKMPTLLTAVWVDYDEHCSYPTSPVKVALRYYEDKDNFVEMGEGDTLVVTQTLGDATFMHRDVGYDLELANNPVGYDISVLIIPGAGYAFDASDSKMSAYVRCFSEDVWVTDTIEQSDLGYRIKTAGEPTTTYYFGRKEVERHFVYDMNVRNTTVFYEDDWDNLFFPVGVLRTDARLLGWALSRTSYKYYTVYDSTFQKDLQSYLSIGMRADTLYAVWDEYAVVENVRVTSENEKNGLFVISQTVNGEETAPIEVSSQGVLVPYSEKGIPFNVKFDVRPGYYINAEEALSSKNIDGVAVAHVANGGEMVLGQANSVLGAMVAAYTYKLTYNVNGGGANVFYGDDWSGNAVKSLDDSVLALPNNIYRADAKLVGWALDSADTVGALDISSDFVGAVTNSSREATLYAVWEATKVETYKVTFANTNVGSLVLTQDVDDTTVSFDVTDTGLVVPVVDGGLRFKAAYTLKAGYAGTTDSIFVVDDLGEFMTSLADGSLTVNEDVTLAIPAEGEAYTLKFDVNREGGTLFYGDDWIPRREYVLSGDSSSIPLPAYVYTADRCMVGWSLSKKGDGELYTRFSSEMVEALRHFQPDDSVHVLYAVWGSGEACDDMYNRVALQGAHGTVALVEVASETDAAPVKHDFAAGDAILLPKVMNGNMLRVRSLPDSSYVLDSLVVVRNQGEDRLVTFEGGVLPYNLDGAALVAYFGKANKINVAFVNPKIEKTGNAIHFGFTTSNFEVTRKVSAYVRLETIDGEFVDEAYLGDSLMPPYGGSWEKYPLGAGRYVLKAILSDAKESDEFVDEFEVVSEIAAVAAEGWQMISIGHLDKDAMDWDGDAKFYWWDESSAYGDFWQYKELDPNEEIDPLRGYWYSSIEGRPLILKPDVEDSNIDNVVWQLDSINSGWNLVANPLGFALNLYGDHPEENVDPTEESRIVFHHWNSEISDYEEVTVVGPYEAVWAKVAASTEWFVPVRPEFVKPADSLDLDSSAKSLNKRARLAKADGLDDWRIKLVLSDAKGHRDSWNMLGASRRPFASDEPPEGMGDHVKLSVLDGNRMLAKSVKAPADEYEWKIALNASSERYGELRLEGISDLNAYGLKVFVTVDGKTTEMHEGEALRLLLKPNAIEATVYVGSAPKVALVKTLAGLKAVQAGATLQVDFDAGAGLAGSAVRVEVLDLKGNVVRSVASNALAGVNRVTLDAPKPGIYMLRVRAGSQMNAGRILVK